MRDAAGQCADAFHALRPQKLRLDLFLFGDVGIDRENRFGLAFIVANERPARLDDQLFPVLGQMLQLAMPVPGREGAIVGFF